MTLNLTVTRFVAGLLALALAAPQMLEARVEPSHGFDMFSAQEEVQAGQQAAAQVGKQLPLLPDSDPVTIYVQQLGHQLAAHAPGEKWPYSFHVVNQKEINAFALPGGPIFVNLGTIQAAVNASPAGSTAFICPGTYPEQVVIAKNFTLTGVSSLGTSGGNASGANNPVIISPAAGMATNAFDLYDGSGIAAQIAVLTPTTATSPIFVFINNIAVNGSNNLISGCGPDLVGLYYQNASGTINHVAASNQALSPDLGGCQSGLDMAAAELRSH